MHKQFLIIAAYLGALSVILGAFGAHTLKDYLTAQALNTFETSVRYQFYHVFALMVTGFLYKSYTNTKIVYAGNMFIMGIIFFCGSLYSLTILGTAHFAWLGAITPIGGVFFIAGWILLAVGLSSKK